MNGSLKVKDPTAAPVSLAESSSLCVLHLCVIGSVLSLRTCRGGEAWIFPSQENTGGFDGFEMKYQKPQNPQNEVLSLFHITISFFLAQCIEFSPKSLLILDCHVHFIVLNISNMKSYVLEIKFLEIPCVFKRRHNHYFHIWP